MYCQILFYAVHFVLNLIVVIEGVNTNKIKGIGCDATCSLVLIGKDGNSASVSPKGEAEQDIIMWMDHRAAAEADIINALAHPLLHYLGGKVSLEMQMPKLMWLKKYLPDTFNRTQNFFDLPDFLTWKLTGSTTRSQCSLVCKWMYEGSPKSRELGWNRDFLISIGLEELTENEFSKIGRNIAMPGNRIGYLREDIAEELGLEKEVSVGASLIDAHAGTLGLIGTRLPAQLPAFPISNRIGMICGTSSCFMLLSENGMKVDGVWGPYYSAVLDKLWLSEGGQSAAGQLLDALVNSHPAKPRTRVPSEICSIIINNLNKMSKLNGCSVQHLTRHFHVYPDFRGNRSPLSDPNLRGMISGLDTNSNEDQLSLIYLAAIQALSIQVKLTWKK